MSDSERLEKLIHDVRSKCASLRDAAGLLRDAAPDERKELLRLMLDQARAVVAVLEDSAPKR